MLNQSLAIVIPTYNKVEALKISLSVMLPELIEHSVGVYIVDDSPNYDIQEFASEIKNIYPNIFYFKNIPKLGHDRNVLAALSKSKALYTWIIGDRVGVIEGSIPKILGLISNQKYDIIAVNKKDRKVDIRSQHFINANEVFDLIGWHLTYTGVTIYSAAVLNKINKIDFDKFVNFPHVALIFLHLSDECSFYWLNEKIVFGIRSGDSYWTNNVFDVFIDDWKRAIENLPDLYTKKNKDKVIIEHSKKSDLFTIKFLLKLRKNGYFNFRDLKKYRRDLNRHSNLNFITLLVISITPLWLIKKTKFIYDYITSILKGSVQGEKTPIQHNLDSNLQKLSNHSNVRNKDLDNYLNVMKNQNYANENLSVVIPSYNRCHFLDKSLEVHIPFAKKYNIPIFISDNCSPDNTMKTVKKWQKKYNLIHYHRHPKALQPDVHFEFALKMPKSRYVWLLGDSSKINNEVFLEILKQSKNDYDMILLNDKGRVRDIKSQLISDHEYLMVSLGWNMSQMSTLIFSKKLINQANYSKFYNSNFIQTGIIFDYLAFKKDIYIKWNQDCSINALKLDRIKKISWQSITFDIWLRKWAQVVMALPDLYSYDAKLEMIQKHNYNAKIFSVRNLLILRSRNYYSLRHFVMYKQYFKVSIGSFSTTKFILIGMLPVSIIRSILKSKKMGALTKFINFSGREIR